MADGNAIWANLAFSSIAPMMAVLVTNPFDVAKVRLQLQGEGIIYRLNPRAPAFTSMWDCLKKTYLHEGLPGLQRGLVVALAREGSRNCLRIGLYPLVMKWLHPPTPTEPAPPFHKRLIGGHLLATALWPETVSCYMCPPGLLTGPLGAFACNPFEVIKVCRV